MHKRHEDYKITTQIENINCIKFYKSHVSPHFNIFVKTIIVFLIQSYFRLNTFLYYNNNKYK